jgi:hypothetical protein
MFEWIILFWALICPNPNHTPGNSGNCDLIHISITTSSAEEDTGGETGNLPPKPPTPPPPPPPPPGS